MDHNTFINETEYAISKENGVVSGKAKKKKKKISDSHALFLK